MLSPSRRFLYMAFFSAQGQGEKDYTSDISFLKFKYGLQNLFTTVKVLRDKRVSSQLELNVQIEKHKNLELEHNEIYSALQSEVAKKVEACQMLETTASKYDLECRLQEKISELNVVSEKHNRDLLLLDAVEKETLGVRKAVAETTLCIKNKEEEVLELKKKLDKILGFETKFIEKMKALETQLKDAAKCGHKKDEIVADLERKLEAALDDHGHDIQLGICEEMLAVKENLLSNMASEKQVLIQDLNKLEWAMEKLQETLKQQDQIIEKYQKQVLDLEQDKKILNDNLSKNEYNMLATFKDNELLSNIIEDQKHSFTTQNQVWYNKKSTLKAQTHELETRIVTLETIQMHRIELGKQTRMYDDSGTVNDNVGDKCLVTKCYIAAVGDTKDSSLQVDTQNELKISCRTEKWTHQMIPKNLYDYITDFSVKTVTIFWGNGKVFKSAWLEDLLQHSQCLF